MSAEPEMTAGYVEGLLHDLARSPTDVAKALDNTLRTALAATDGGTQEGAGDTVGLESNLWDIWGRFTGIAQDDRSLHDRLISILKALKATASSECYTWVVWGEKFDWPLLGASIREGYNGPMTYITHIDLELERLSQILSGQGAFNPDNADEVKAHTAAVHWLNLNYFVARIWAEDVEDFEMYGLWAMRDGLEESNADDPSNPRALKVQVAAAWIETAGPLMYTSRTIFGPNGNPDWQENAGAPGRGGDKWMGVDGYAPERWELWKDEFRKYYEENKNGLNDRSAQSAERALVEMERLEAGAA